MGKVKMTLEKEIQVMELAVEDHQDMEMEMVVTQEMVLEDQEVQENQIVDLTLEMMKQPEQSRNRLNPYLCWQNP